MQRYILSLTFPLDFLRKKHKILSISWMDSPNIQISYGIVQSPIYIFAILLLKKELSTMSRVCAVTGKRTTAGRMIARRGLPKYKGGVGLKTTGITARKFKPNTQTKRLWVPELNKFVKIKLCTRALKTIARDGAYQVLTKAGVISPVKPKSKKSKAPEATKK